MRPRRTVAAALVAFLTFASLGHAQVKPVVIDDDDGGNVNTFLMWYGRLADSAVPVRIRGLCASACTLVTSLPREQVCIEPTGSLGFHLFSQSGVPNMSLTLAYARRYYPQALQLWLAKFKLTDKMIFMPSEEVVSLGIVPACDVGSTEGDL